MELVLKGWVRDMKINIFYHLQVCFLFFCAPVGGVHSGNTKPRLRLVFHVEGLLLQPSSAPGSGSSLTLVSAIRDPSNRRRLGAEQRCRIVHFTSVLLHEWRPRTPVLFLMMKSQMCPTTPNVTQARL